MGSARSESTFLRLLRDRTKRNMSPRKLLTSQNCAHHFLAPRLFSLVWVNAMVRKVARSTDHLLPDDHLPGAEESMLSSIQETNEHVKEARVLRPPLEPEDDYTLAESRMRRALDRLKRAATKVIDVIAATMEALLSAVCTVRDLAAHVLFLLLSRQGSVSEDYASLLDLFFVLARTTLAPNNPVLTDAAYDLLSRAAGLLGFQLADDHGCPHSTSPPASVTEEAFANFVRCLSGAFHGLGGTLYQAGKYGSAIRFLRRGCRMGAVALHLRKNCDARVSDNAYEQQKAATGKEIEGWGQLRDQLSRRWELLGVCCSKIGDRQVCQSLTLPCVLMSEPFTFCRVPTTLSLNVSPRMFFRIHS